MSVFITGSYIIVWISFYSYGWSGVSRLSIHLHQYSYCNIWPPFLVFYMSLRTMSFHLTFCLPYYCRSSSNLAHLFKIPNKNPGLYRYVSLSVCVLFVHNPTSLCLLTIHKTPPSGWLIIFVHVSLLCYVLGYFF